MRYTALAPPSRVQSTFVQTNAIIKDIATLRAAAGTEDGFLVFLGKRVRELRNRRGLTRKMLAHEADVSERHLAQLEAGEGNISIVLLRRIALALSVSLAELFAPERAEEPEAKRLVERLLGRLPAHRLEEVLHRLLGEFGPEEAVRRKRVAQ